MRPPFRLLLALFCLLTPGVAAGQSTVPIRHAVYVDRIPALVEVVFEASFGTADAKKAASDITHYRLLDLYGGAQQSLQAVLIPIARAEAFGDEVSGNTVQLHLAAPLPAAVDHRYILMVSGVSLGETPIPVSAAPVSITMAIAGPPAGRLTWKKAANRDAADFFFSGVLSRSKDTDFFGSVDMKVRYPTVKTSGGHVHTLSPTFDLAISADPGADPDSVTFGVVWQFFPRARAGDGGMPVTRWENAVEHEASRDFEYRTAVARSEWLFLPRPFRVGKKGNLWLGVLAGAAIGRIFEAPADTADSGTLYRLVGGLALTAEAPIAGKQLQISADYIVREQFQDEVAGMMSLGKGTHQWASVKAEIAFNDFVSVGILFQDGEKPPTYTRVKRSLSLDFTVKAARKR